MDPSTHLPWLHCYLSAFRSVLQWLNRVQSFLYCNENGFWGTFLESQRMCVLPHGGHTLPAAHPLRDRRQQQLRHVQPGQHLAMRLLQQGLQAVPRTLRATERGLGAQRAVHQLRDGSGLPGPGAQVPAAEDGLTAAHPHDLHQQRGAPGDLLRPTVAQAHVADAQEQQNRMDYLHMIVGLSMKICQMRNSSVDPMFFVYVNPFSGSHSEGWSMPFGEHGYPRWEKVRLQNSQCFNWTLLLGNRWKTFFETVHIYLRSRAKVPTVLRNDTGQGPVDLSDPNKRQIYIKISDIQVFGYSLRFNADLLRSAVQQVNQSYTQGTQFYSSSSIMLLLLDIRERINRLAPPVAPGKPQLDLFSCMLKHRLKLNNSEMIRVNHALDMYNTEILKQSDHLTTKTLLKTQLERRKRCIEDKEKKRER